MKKINHNLLPTQKSRKYNLNVAIDLYAYSSELYDELESIGIIERIKNTPQLGVIKVVKKLKKSRYDYMMLQLYLHQLIKKGLQSQLRFTYNNVVKSIEFDAGVKYLTKMDKPTIGDMLQLLILVYNMGHFYNTFTASRAVVMLASQENLFKNIIINSSAETAFKFVANKLISENDYQRFHLLNSLLILEKCNQTKSSVLFAKKLLYYYIAEEKLEPKSKLHYVFDIFRHVRNVSYIAYDLQVANTPFTIDLCEEDGLLLLFKELISNYNNNESSNRLIESIGKMLDDTVYNEDSNAICYYRISRRMVFLLKKNGAFGSINYYSDLFENTNSPLNDTYRGSRDYVSHDILKLTFSIDERVISKKLLVDLEDRDNMRVGYYDRHYGEQTILTSIKKKCDNKTTVAFRILKYSISALRRLPSISVSDERFLLCCKFFLYYFFNENPVVIKPTMDSITCVLCTRGKNARKFRVQELLEKNSNINEDQRHETRFLLQCINDDKVNDTSICIPASIVVYQKDVVGKTLCEFDGMIIHPMRKTKQIILLEAKNTANNPTCGKKCLVEKLDKFSFEYKKDDIEVIAHDARLIMSL